MGPLEPVTRSERRSRWGRTQVGERVLGFSGGLEEDDPPALYALDLAGRPLWRAPLAMKGPDGDVLLAAAGATLLTGFAANIAVFALP